MRNVIIASVLALFAFTAGGAPARAADMPLKAPPPPPPCDWCGLYAGINLGADWGSSAVTPGLGVPFPVFTGTIPGVGIIITPAEFATLPATSGSATSVIGGGQIGYNWQNGQVVYGLEGDIDGTGLRENSSSTLTRTTLSGTQTVTANFSADVDWIATVRGRLGYAVDRGLLYATGGLAVAGTTLNTAYSIVEGPQLPGLGPFPGSASSSKVLTGWTVGGGGEWAFSKTWSAALEYRHSDFGTGTYNIGFSDTSLVPFVSPTAATAHFTVDQVTARLNYHFN